MFAYTTFKREMTLQTFQSKIEESVNKKVELRVNDNCSTMLSVRWDHECTKVSMHRMFLEAPKNIMDALACHIEEENSSLCPTVREYIDVKLRTLDYSHKIDNSKLSTKGVVYDLQSLYDEINEEYFDSKLLLKITWYGKVMKRRRSEVTFGLYQEALKLIKIHRMIDSEFFPSYFVRFVIYHEMLHHHCPPYYDETGRHRIHTEEFKRRESAFKEVEQARSWMEDNYDNFFTM